MTEWAISKGLKPYTYAPVAIGDYCYIGFNVIISKGVVIGDHVIIGANSFVNKNIPSGCKVWEHLLKSLSLLIRVHARSNKKCFF